MKNESGNIWSDHSRKAVKALAQGPLCETENAHPVLKIKIWNGSQNYSEDSEEACQYCFTDEFSDILALRHAFESRAGRNSSIKDKKSLASSAFQGIFFVSIDSQFKRGRFRDFKLSLTVEVQVDLNLQPSWTQVAVVFGPGRERPQHAIEVLRVDLSLFCLLSCHGAWRVKMSHM